MRSGRAPLGAPPWRFSAGSRASFSGISSGSVQRAPRSQVVVPGGRGTGPPEPAVASHSRETPRLAPTSGSPLEAPLMSQAETLMRESRTEVKMNYSICSRFRRAAKNGLHAPDAVQRARFLGTRERARAALRPGHSVASAASFRSAQKVATVQAQVSGSRQSR